MRFNPMVFSYWYLMQVLEEGSEFDSSICFLAKCIISLVETWPWSTNPSQVND